MKTATLLTSGSAAVLAVFISAPAHAGLNDFLDSAARKAQQAADQTSQTVNSVKQGVSNVQSVGQSVGQTVQTVSDNPTGALTSVLMERLGVTQAQAEGGAGALFQLAKTRMQDEAFAKLSEAVPGMEGYLAAAPQAAQAVQNVKQAPASALTNLGANVVSQMTGVDSQTIMGVGSLVGSFKQLGLSSEQMQQFVPVMVDYVRNKSGELVANTLMGALGGS
ncbi:MAG: DUF2780 domain-containing protein [Gammaproteobacteria bacterium]